MSRPRLLDTYCGAGGAGMGYHLAGFEVVGVDHEPQPHYPFEFIRADALEVLSDAAFLAGFDALHGSPPCQGYSRMRHLPWLAGREYPMLLEPTWRLFEESGLPWIIENVEDAPMPYSTVLCGWTFGLPVYRHRRFGSSFLAMAPPHRRHEHVIAAGGASVSKRFRSGGSHPSSVATFTAATAAEAIGIGWMSRAELSQAIPPVYTEFLGEQMLAYVTREETP